MSLQCSLLALVLFASVSQLALGSTGCSVAYEKDGGFTRGPSVELTVTPSEGTTDARYVYKAWTGAMRNGLYMEVFRREDNRRVASFSGPVEPGRDEILQVGDVWLTCVR